MDTTIFSEEELVHYSRQMILPELGLQGQKKLKKARVLVIGAGGLGCPALQYLAAAGVGHLGIVDGDTVAASNLHRQILFTRADTGRSKAQAAAEKLSALNPFIELQAYPVFLDQHNAAGLVATYDLVIDGSDNFPARYLVNDTCLLKGKPFVFAALHQFELQLTVFNYRGGPTYRCLYPSPPSGGEMPSCNDAGVMGMLPGMAGMLQALEAFKIITGSGQVLSGKLLILNLLTHQRHLLELPAVPGNLQPPARPGEPGRDSSKAGATGCGTERIPEIDMATLEEWRASTGVQLIDVRSPAEFETLRLHMGEVNLPLEDLFHACENDLLRANTAKPVITICQTGLRSKKAALLLKTRNKRLRVFSLKNGLSGR